MTSAELDALRDRCTRFLNWHGPTRVAAVLADIPADTVPDRYGEGGVVAELEGEVAGLLGKPAAVFMPSGTMAQQATLRVHADRRGRRVVVFHPTCHLEVHEGEYPRGRLAEADEVFTSSSVREVMPVVRLDGVPVATQVTGMFLARSNPTTRRRPAPMGYSVGHPAITAGSIGARVVDGSGNVYVLSNNHVLANSNDASIGDPALQPGPFDGGTSADRIGTLFAFQSIDFSGGDNTIDAAIAISTTADLSNATPEVPLLKLVQVGHSRWPVEKAQADYPSSRRWVGTRRIGYHRRDGVARTGGVVSAPARRVTRRNRMPRTTRRPAPPRA